ncbi:hypothetical protein QWA68_015279 [Fusarium oxysporum]|nr:hypothetical protein QWA68_015279 [Fusarium oxysporum]
MFCCILTCLGPEIKAAFWNLGRWIGPGLIFFAIEPLFYFTTRLIRYTGLSVPDPARSFISVKLSRTCVAPSVTRQDLLTTASDLHFDFERETSASSLSSPSLDEAMTRDIIYRFFCCINAASAWANWASTDA